MSTSLKGARESENPASFSPVNSAQNIGVLQSRLVSPALAPKEENCLSFFQTSKSVKLSMVVSVVMLVVGIILWSIASTPSMLLAGQILFGIWAAPMLIQRSLSCLSLYVNDQNVMIL